MLQSPRAEQGESLAERLRFAHSATPAGQALL